MNNPKIRLSLAALILTLASLACTTVLGGGPAVMVPTQAPLPTTAAAMPTQPPQPTQAPTSAIPEPVTIQLTLPFYDDFSDPNTGWNESDYGHGFSRYEAGFFRITENDPNTYIYAAPQFTVQDVILSVEAENRGIDNNAFGFVCRVLPEPGNFYFFEVTSDGYIRIGVSLDGEYTGLMEWEETYGINTGKAVNNIQAACIGNSFRLYVNGEMLADVRNDQIQAPGYAGLIASAFDNPGVDIWFDNFSATAP